MSARGGDHSVTSRVSLPVETTCLQFRIVQISLWANSGAVFFAHNAMEYPLSHLDLILKSHPGHTETQHPEWLACLAACLNCAQVCRKCADACVGESKGDKLTECIRRDLDCATVCDATAQVLSRTTEPDWKVVTALLQACVAACASCASACEHHAAMMEHCRVCAEACRECEVACKALVPKAAACCC